MRGIPFVAGRLGLYPDRYDYDDLRRCTEASMERLGVGCLDLTQRHCIPTQVMQRGEVFDHLRRLCDEGLIRRFGASVESMEDALLCLKQEGLPTSRSVVQSPATLTAVASWRLSR